MKTVMVNEREPHCGKCGARLDLRTQGVIALQVSRCKCGVLVSSFGMNEVEFKEKDWMPLADILLTWVEYFLDQSEGKPLTDNRGFPGSGKGTA